MITPTPKPSRPLRYCVVSDNDGHKFLCPAESRDEAYEYFEALEDVEGPDYVERPEWLKLLGAGLSDLTFTNPQFREGV